ncbi:phage tail protein [Verminephrobacter aporrectodeae subsp. tuberculatae]|uniref:Phage tail protein n=1 Tax=Verminephrobacter aporrectodeae subsp. tuberculatae TaxID=1110392 RepID=A0ABT3KRW3_9BURK|nr:tail protein X [Verminephrobacter aporrectodeae]MCW5320540.1 phage tail protein [Verminephrobacter aporrectodeae subsp. tuberculatae]
MADLTVMARDGDTVDQLCWRHLGRTAGATEATLTANPGLARIGPQLPAGTRVQLVSTTQKTRETVQLWD